MSLRSHLVKETFPTLINACMTAYNIINNAQQLDIDFDFIKERISNHKTSLDTCIDIVSEYTADKYFDPDYQVMIADKHLIWSEIVTYDNDIAVSISGYYAESIFGFPPRAKLSDNTTHPVVNLIIIHYMGDCNNKSLYASVG